MKTALMIPMLLLVMSFCRKPIPQMKRYTSLEKYINENLLDDTIDIGNRILNPDSASTTANTSTAPTTTTVTGTAQKQLNSKYGYPDQSYINNYCETWKVKAEFPWFPADSMVVNKDFKVMLQKAFTQLQIKGLQKEIKMFGGAQNFRNVRGGTAISIHAWGGAIDLNPTTEYQGRNSTDWSPAFIQVMKSAGIFWGGDWPSNKDPMHFAMVNG